MNGVTLDAVPAHVNGWIEVSEQGATLILRIGGELDAASCKVIEPTISTAIATAGSVIIDLSELTFCDSSGVGLFIATHTKAESDGTTLAIRNVRPPVRRIFEITNLDAVIELID
jgi:anti-sigma B factor antagonist